MTGRSSRAWLAYEVVDVFTDTPFAGNPLAVVLDADDLPTSAMQELAAEFHLSETAFPVAAAPGADYGLRIFTPATELPFAGHPSIGAACVLRRLGRIPVGRVVQSCGAGLLDVVVGEHDAVLAGGPPTYAPVGEAGRLLAAVGLAPGDLAGAPSRAGGGIEFTYLPVYADAVARAVPDVAAMLALPGVGSGVCVTAWDAAMRRAHSRVFAPAVGVTEDPATGSAAVGLSVHLAAAGLLPDGHADYVVDQGAEVGRPSRLLCGCDVRDGRAVATTVGGSVVSIARGEVRRPG